MKQMKKLAVVAVALFSTGCSSTPPCENETLAFVMSQDFVRKQLRSPSTANFPSITADGVSTTRFTADDGKCAFRVRLYVDAQNAFGGIVRESYTVELTPDSTGRNWSLISIN
ncbi:hypothetical protein [Sphingomonas sp.]|uniref:hypothetical protein n=1 Tax=Sphingomonas sp. TaxID=28214 RepID=UPI003F729B4B